MEGVGGGVKYFGAPELGTAEKNPQKLFGGLKVNFKKIVIGQKKFIELDLFSLAAHSPAKLNLLLSSRSDKVSLELVLAVLPLARVGIPASFLLQGQGK